MNTFVILREIWGHIRLIFLRRCLKMANKEGLSKRKHKTKNNQVAPLPLVQMSQNMNEYELEKRSHTKRGLLGHKTCAIELSQEEAVDTDMQRGPSSSRRDKIPFP